MAQLMPVDGDPFAAAPPTAQPAQPQLVPVDNNPFDAPQPNGPWNAALEAGNAALLGLGTREMAAVQAAKAKLWDGQSISWGDAYDQALAHYQGARSGYEAANPGTALAANLVGSAAPAILAAPLAGPGVVGNALTGAAIGGVSGAANANDGDVLNAGLAGAGLGGALGGASVPVGKALGAVAGNGAQRLRDAIFNRAANNAGLTSGAADALNGALARQGMTPDSALATAQALGPGATLADTGQAARDMTARLAAREPAVAPTIADNLTARADQLTPRINSVVDQAIGPDLNAPEQLAALKLATSLNGRAGYGPVLNSSATVDVTPVRDMIAQTRVDPIAAAVEEDPISAALGKAQKLFVGSDPENLPINVAHQAQSAIGDMADSAFRSGNMAQARGLTQVRNALLDQMPDAYNAARTQYATDKGIEDAFIDGRSVLASRSDGQVLDPDLLQSRLQGMSQPEQDAYRLGARKAVSDVMGQARSDPAGLQASLANEGGYKVGKLKAVFGDDPVNAILGELDKQAQIRATNNLALGGSKTAMTSAADSLIPTARQVGSLGHGGWSPVAGAIIGRELGESLGLPEAPSAVAGAGAGLLWNGAIAPAINAGRVASQNASRAALAGALTSSPTDALAQALAKRQAGQAVPPVVSEAARRLAGVLARQGIASAPAAQNYFRR